LKEYQINNFIQEQDKLKNNQDRNWGKKFVWFRYKIFEIEISKLKEYLKIWIIRNSWLNTIHFLCQTFGTIYSKITNEIIWWYFYVWDEIIQKKFFQIQSFIKNLNFKINVLIINQIKKRFLSLIFNLEGVE
jgi:hypothetical protein